MNDSIKAASQSGHGATLHLGTEDSVLRCSIESTTKNGCRLTI